MTVAPGLRARKKARTRDALVQAALDLFEAKGFEGTTVDEIAAAAEISRRTFFRYFPTKEAVLFPDRDVRLSHFRELLFANAGQSPFVAVRRACMALAADYERDRLNLLRQSRVVEASAHLIAFERELDRDYEDAMAEALRAREASGSSALRSRVLAGAVIGIVRAVLREWFSRDGETDLLALGEAAMDWLENGFGASEPSDSEE